MNFTSHLEEEVELRERSSIALRKAKKLEAKDLKKGHRYVRLGDRTLVLVECDKKGNPTEQGKRQLELYEKTAH